MRKIYFILGLAFIFMLSCENNLQMILPQGPQGPQGEKGEDGLSAFELWKIHYDKGPNATFDDFIASLKGKDGSDGANGKDGATPVIGSNGNWWIDGKDTGVPATGKDGQNGIDGITPQIGGNGNWWIDGKDTGVPVTGKDGKDGIDGVTPVIGENGNWYINGKDTGVLARGKDGQDGATPEIGSNGNWWINGKDTGVPAKGQDGQDGYTPKIGKNGNWWIGGVDTGVPARGKDGQDGRTPVVVIGWNGNWFIDGEDTGVPARGKDGIDGINGITPYIGTNGNWFIGDKDTGVPARGKDGKDGIDGIDGVSPTIGTNGNWYINGVDTGVPAKGKNGQNGVDGKDGKSAYELWKEAVDKGEMTNKDGSPYTGTNTWESFLKWLQGGDVSVLHQYWLSQGNTGDISAFIEALFDCHCDGITIIVIANDECVTLNSEGAIAGTYNATLKVGGAVGTSVSVTGGGFNGNSIIPTGATEVSFTIPRGETDKNLTINCTEQGSSEQVTKTAKIPALKYVKFDGIASVTQQGTEQGTEQKDKASISFETEPSELFVNGTLVYTSQNGAVAGTGWDVSSDKKTFEKVYARGANVQTLTFKAVGKDGGCSILNKLLEIPQLTPVEVEEITLASGGDCEVILTLTGTQGMTVKAKASYSGASEITMTESSAGTYTATFPRKFAAYKINITASKEGAGNKTAQVNVDGGNVLTQPFKIEVIGTNTNSSSNSTPSVDLKITNNLNTSITIVISRGGNKNLSQRHEPWIEGIGTSSELIVTLPANEAKTLKVNKDVRFDFGVGNYTITLKSSSLCEDWSTTQIIYNQRDFKFSFKKPSGGPGGPGGIGGDIPEQPKPEEGKVSFLVIVEDAVPNSYVQFQMSTGGLNNVFGGVKPVNANGFYAQWVTLDEAQFNAAMDKTAKFLFSNNGDVWPENYGKTFTIKADMIDKI